MPNNRNVLEDPQMEDRRSARRWPRFSLAAIFAAMLAVGVLLSGYQVGFRRGYLAGERRRQAETEYDELYTEVYYVGDLLVFRPGGSLRTAADGPIRQSDLRPLVELITSTVEPHRWIVGGFSGPSCDSLPEVPSLVVVQSRPVHEQVALLLHQLRARQWRQAIRRADRYVAAQLARWLR